MNVPQCIERIAPKWSKILKDGNSLSDFEFSRTVDGSVLDLGSSSCCIVGEAHAFSNRYFNEQCDTCTNFSLLFFNLNKHHAYSRDLADGNLVDLTQMLGKDFMKMNDVELLQEFCNHFDAEHGANSQC